MCPEFNTRNTELRKKELKIQEKNYLHTHTHTHTHTHAHTHTRARARARTHDIYNRNILNIKLLRK